MGILCAGIVTVLLFGFGCDEAGAERATTFASGSILVGFDPGTGPTARRTIARRAGLHGGHALVSAADLAATRAGAVTSVSKRRTDPIGPIFRFTLPAGSESRASAEIEHIPGVRFAEPDFLLESTATPDDPDLNQQWAIENNGQTVNGVQGVSGADENVLAAWGVTTGDSDTVVAVVDTGVDYEHPDLAANIWSNPEGLGDCPVGSHGVDTVGTGAPTCDPMDDDLQYGGHGTHVAGIIGARGDNGVGVAGVNWSTTMLPVKFVDSQGQGRTSDLLEGLQWLLDLKQAGVDLGIVNDSQTFVGTPFSQATADMIDLLGADDILFVTAAGNSGADNDDPAARRYPCGYGRPNEICVTATNNRDQLPGFANYGDETVDLGAPGSNIYSTLRDASPLDPGPNYGFISGGSMAAAQVSGAAALILSTGYRSATELKSMLLDNVDPLPSLAGKVRTGGRLDVCNAIPACNPDDDGDGVPDAEDVCPSLAGDGTASGCPNAPRSLTLAYDAPSGRFNGTLAAPSAPACESGRQVTLWRLLPGPDQVAGSTLTASNGAYSLDAPDDGGTYEARADAETIADVADCGEATSAAVDNCDMIAACNPDDDGDGVPDAEDACPSLAGGGTASGCPTAAGTLSLRYEKKRMRFKGRIRYPTAAACASTRPVTLWKQRRGRDRRLATIASRPDGAFRIAVEARRGRYYAKLRRSILPDVASCAPVGSRRIRVRG